MKTKNYLLLSLLVSNVLLSQKVDCDLLFCGNLSSLKEVLSEGDKVAFGINMAQIEGFYELTNTNTWKKWINNQYGVSEHVKMVRYNYDKKVNGRTVVIETFYNYNRGEFLFGRVLYEGEYDKMMNFILKIHYQNSRPDFNARAQFSNTANSKYFSNADTLLKSLTGYIETL